MTNILILLIFLVLGILLQRVKSLPKNFYVTLNKFILHVPLPALTLLTLSRLTPEGNLVILTLIPWLLFILSWMIFSTLGKKFHWPTGLTGCLILTTGLGNTSFVGFPVIEAFYGKEALKYALLMDQPGSFLILSTLGVLVASRYSSGEVSPSAILRKVLLFPPFISFVVATFMAVSSLRFTGITAEILLWLSLLLSPLALLSVGLQLRISELKGQWKSLFVGLSYKLILTPILILFLCRGLHLPRELSQVAVIESAMAPMITASILASAHNLDPRLAGLMIGIGVPLSFFTLGIWYFVV